jgi:hypothetical protein
VLVVPPGGRLEDFGERFRDACDLAIALAPCVPDFRLVGATRAPIRIGYTYVRRYLVRLTAGRYLTRLAISEADPQLSERDPARLVRHEVEQVLDLVRLAGGAKLSFDLVIPVNDVDRRAVAHVPAGGIAFHLGLRWFSNGSTVGSTLELLRRLRAFGLPVVVTYGVDALEQVAAVRTAEVADALVGGVSFRPTVVVFEHRYFNLSSQEWSPYRVPSVCLRKPPNEDPAELAALRASVLAAVGELLDAKAMAIRS